jgi:hypothetical protein
LRLLRPLLAEACNQNKVKTVGITQEHGIRDSHIIPLSLYCCLITVLAASSHVLNNDNSANFINLRDWWE